MALFNSALNQLMDATLCQPLRPANGILDRLGRRTSMADHGNAVNAQERRPTEFRVIDSLLQAKQRRGNERIGQAAEEGSGDFLEQQLLDRIGHSLGNLQRDVPDEAIAHHHISAPAVHITALDIADEVERTGFEELERLLRDLLPFAVFFSDTQQPDTWVGLPKEIFAILIPHDGELGQMLSRTIHVCPYIQHDRSTSQSGQACRDRRTLDTLRQPEYKE